MIDESLELLEKMMSGVALCELCRDQDGRPVGFKSNYVNPAFYRIVGKIIGVDHVEELSAGDPVPGFLKSHIELNRVIGRVLASGLPDQLELHVPGKSEKYLSWEVYPMRSQDQFGLILSDITESKEAERRRLDKERWLQFATRSAGIGVWAWNIEKNILEWDEQMFLLYGVARASFTGRFELWESCVHPDDRARTVNDVKLTLAGKEKFNSEFRVVRQDGAIRQLASDALLVRDESGKPLRLIGVNRDVTDERERERRLKESESRFREYFELPLIGGAITNPNTKEWLEVNDEACRILGYPREELLRKTWTELTHPDDLAADVELFNRCLKMEIDNYSLVKRFVQKSGQVIWATIAVAAVRDNQGNIDHFVALIQDISDRKRAEAELQKSLKQFRLLFETMQQGVVFQDRQGHMISMNPAAIQILGFTPERFVWQVSTDPEHGPRREDGSPLRDEEHPALLALSKGAIVRDRVIQIFNPTENQYRWISITSVPLFSEDQAEPVQVYTVFSDISARIHIEKELKSALEDAQSASRSKSQFLDIAAHELRTPVTGLSLLLQFSQRQLEKYGRPVDAPTLARLRGEADRLSRLVVDLLEVSRLDRGVIRLKRELIDLAKLISDCLDTLKVQVPKRTLVFRQADQPVLLIMDPTRIYQVLLNFLDNAVKYTPEATPIEVTIEDNPDRVRVSVIDQGPGIPEARQKTLFAPFERGTGDQEERTTGLGLGLFICRGIVELHHGSIGVMSSPGKGSTFYFEIPREESSK